jgi:hypothetical protein
MAHEICLDTLENVHVCVENGSESVEKMFTPHRTGSENSKNNVHVSGENCSGCSIKNIHMDKKKIHEYMKNVHVFFSNVLVWKNILHRSKTDTHVQKNHDFFRTNACVMCIL